MLQLKKGNKITKRDFYVLFLETNNNLINDKPNARVIFKSYPYSLQDVKLQETYYNKQLKQKLQAYQCVNMNDPINN